FPPGGVDITGRLLANKMSELLGQPVVVDNRGGANGLIGSELVARSAPDGYTILLTTPSTHVTAVFLQKSIPYDPVKDFTPICAVLEPVSLLVVHPSLPVNSVQELIAHAKKNPGKLTYSSSGIGSVFHLTGEALKEAGNVDILHVPYKGTGPSLADVVAGRISMTFSALSTSRPLIVSGKVKALAVAEPRRYAGLPNIPTVAEGLPGFNKPSTWFGFFGPAGMPRPVVQRLNAEMVKTAHAPDLRDKLDQGGFSIIAGTPEDFAAILKQGLEVYGRLVKSVGLKPE
ncbi:MAG: hypothetical protein A3I01_09565, partial [Betaproteobacteria bacterium RIFCSPLOWO2_02_FULL_65_24]